MPDNIIFSDDEALGYVQQLENPNKVGWDKKNKVWRTPKLKGYDKNQIAYGLDIREENNPIVYNYLKSKGRLDDPWLTDSEAKNLMSQTWGTKKAVMDKLIQKTGGNISLRGYNVLSGMVWHGHPAKMALKSDSVTGKAFTNAIASGDRDLNSVFDAYYGYGSNATLFADRIRLDKPFRDDIQEIRTGDGNKILKFRVQEQKPFESTWKSEPPVKTIYPLKNTTPESISSWSGADAPNATPRLKDFLEVRQEDLNRGIDVYGDPVSPFSLRLRLPSLTSLLQLNSPLKLAELYFADALGISDMLPLAPNLFPRLKNGKLPRYEDGEIPFTPGGTADATWHENWLNGRKRLLLNNYNISPKKFDDYGTGTAELQIENLKGTKEYLGVGDVNREYGYDYPMGYVGDNMGGFTGGVTVTGEGNLNNIIMYPSKSLHPKFNKNYITPELVERGLNTPMSDDEILKWNENVARKSLPQLLRNEIFVHEHSHALNTPLKNTDPIGTLPQDYKIDEINKKYGLKSTKADNSKSLTEEEYHMVPNEIYAGLNEARYKLQLSPDHVVTKEEILQWKKDGKLNQFLKDKPDDVLVEYFNEVASNPNPLFDPNAILYLFGPTNGKILYARDGKLPGYSNGKPIHIKPANRGKLTRLKKRTGKSEAELYRTGSAATRKMIIFARNARKWKH